MSSHREAPEILKDPVADNTDTYAFISPDAPDTVTLLTNYVPLQGPDGGPNFYEFGDDVLYSIYVDNDGDGEPNIEYQFRFKNKRRNDNTFLYNTGTIEALNSENWNSRQFYDVTKIEYGKPKKGKNGKSTKKSKSTLIGKGLICPPCNIGPHSTPNYENLAKLANHGLKGGGTVFAGQRREGFYVDLGSIFDLADLRPLQTLHTMPMSPAMGVDATNKLNVHTIAVQVPIEHLTRGKNKPTDVMDPGAVIGVWGAASRRKSRVLDPDKNQKSESGPWVQVSRLGNPLFNEVLVPLGMKDKWNSLSPAYDRKFLKMVQYPELAKLIPQLYPGVFTQLAGLKDPREDLVAILLTGLPKGVVPGFQNYTGTTYADMLRLNVAVPPSANENSLGVIGGDLGGYPNGRRVADDVVNIELRAIAGLTYPLVKPSYIADPAASQVTQGVTPGPDRYQSTFPYLGTPLSGFSTPAS